MKDYGVFSGCEIEVDISNLHLEIGGGWGFDPGNPLRRFFASLELRHVEFLVPEAKGTADEELPELTLATAMFSFLKLEGDDLTPVEALDIDSADTANLIPLFDMHGGWAKEIESKLSFHPDGLLTVERVQVPIAFRGHGFGLFLVAEFLNQFSDNKLVACTPAAFEVDPEDLNARKTADIRIKQLWKKFGFIRFTQTCWYLDPTLQALDDSRALTHKLVQRAKITLPTNSSR